MFAIPAAAMFFTFVFLRPHEIFEALRTFNVNLVSGLVAYGMVLDYGTGRLRPRGSPLLYAMLGLLAWYIITVAVRTPDQLGAQLSLFGVSLIGFLLLSQGFQRLRSIGVVSGLLVALVLGLAAMGVYQGLQPMTCFVQAGQVTPVGPIDVPDGRPCEHRADCEQGGQPGKEYICERPGLLGTRSYGGRVRFRGLIEDPNELAWVIAMGTPLAFALYERRRSLSRLVVLGATLVLGFICVIMTQSRSGQISMVAMLGVYFVRRFGKWGLISGMVVALPLLFLGGRSGEEAESSSESRLECWSEAIQMWRENPLMGVGGGQFLEHHVQTAHSSFLLTLAELGPLGLILWSIVVYLAFKIPIRVQLELRDNPDAAGARSWATAILGMLMALVVSVFFLTLAYSAILWIFMGLTAALYGAVREHAPNFHVRFGWRDLGAVVAGDVVLVTGTMLYLRLKGI
jgi:hypothetical protein